MGQQQPNLLHIKLRSAAENSIVGTRPTFYSRHRVVVGGSLFFGFQRSIVKRLAIENRKIHSISASKSAAINLLQIMQILVQIFYGCATADFIEYLLM